MPNGAPNYPPSVLRLPYSLGRVEIQKAWSGHQYMAYCADYPSLKLPTNDRASKRREKPVEASAPTEVPYQSYHEPDSRSNSPQKSRGSSYDLRGEFKDRDMSSSVKWIRYEERKRPLESIYPPDDRFRSPQQSRISSHGRQQEERDTDMFPSVHSLRAMESMYSPDDNRPPKRVSRDRRSDSETNSMMYDHY